MILAGHSEGALWALLVAEHVHTDAVISLEGAGRPIGDVLRDQLADASGVTRALLMQADQIITQLEAGKRVAESPPRSHHFLAPTCKRI